MASNNIIKPSEKHPGWNAFHYFNYHYRQNKANSSKSVEMNEILVAWSQMDEIARKPFLELQKVNMNKYRKGVSLKNTRKHKRRPSASSVMKKRLSLLEYGPKNGENWNTWASGIQKQLIKWFQGQHPEFKTIKEVTYEWQCHWLALKPAEQGEELRAFFGY